MRQWRQSGHWFNRLPLLICPATGHRWEHPGVQFITTDRSVFSLAIVYITRNKLHNIDVFLAGMFLTLVMTLNALSLVFATLVINLKKKGDRFFCTPVPYCLLVLCKRFLAKLTCTRFFNYHQFYGDCEDCEPPGDHDVTSCGTSEMNTQSTSRETETEFIDEGDVQRGRRKFFKNRQKSQEEGLCSEQNLRDLRYEWYFVAEVLDKTLFMFFVVALIGITSGPLIIVPWIVSKNEVFDSTSWYSNRCEHWYFCGQYPVAFDTNMH